MTIKQKFSSIDQSKLTADQKSFLDKIKNVTKNFTDVEMNKKVEQPLDNFIAKAKEKMPEAIKSAPAKATPKSKAKPSQTRKPKRTPMSLAKEIRKEGESWSDARARASKMMKEDSKDLSKTVESELDKLSKLVRSQKARKKLSGLSGTDIRRDASRKAKPKGRRISKEGNVYYENRDNRTDRLSPNYPKNAPFLAEGGYLTDPTFGNFQNQVLAEGGNIDAFTLRMVKSNGVQPAEVLKEDANVVYNKGGALKNERRHVNHNEDYEVRYAKPRPSRTGYKGNRRFELGGTMATDLAGHTGGGDAGLNTDVPLSGTSGVAYTGLVGETGAMSSGEMFENGGGVGKLKVGDFIKKKGSNIVVKVVETGNDFRSGYDTITIYNDVLNKKITLVDWSDYEKINFMSGGTLPYGSEQSYMITEALGNPAQHYANGGGIPNNYNGKYYGDIWNEDWTDEQKYHFLTDHENEIGFNEEIYGQTVNRATKRIKTSKGNDAGFQIVDREKLINTRASELPRYVKFAFEKHIREGQYARGGGVRTVGNREYSYGRNWTNDHRHVNKGEDHEVKYTRKGKFLGVFNKGGSVTNERRHVNHDEDYEVRYAKPRPTRKGYKGARKFMAGGSMETPRIYVADLEAYNNGRLVGEWLDLADYNDADELMQAIQDVLKKSGGEEYAIHDAEYIPRSMYSEYMGQRDFEELYEMMELAKDKDLPLEVVQDVVSQYSASAIDEFQGKYDNAEDFAQQLVDDIGIESFNDFQYYLDVSETDRRLLAQEMADSYVDDIRDEDGGNRLIAEAGMDVNEYENADEDTQEEMLDKAREIVYDEYYETWYDGLDDPYYFLVEEQGLYDAESFAKANFVRVDYEKLGDALEQDYTFVEYDGDLYVFNIR